MQQAVARDLNTATLHERLGGSAGIERIIDEVVEAHMHNPEIKARFVPYREEPERLSAVKAQLRSFFGAGAGGPEPYTGRSMVEAHRGMNISEAEYMAATDDILNSLDKLGYDRSVRDEVLAILYGLKDEIIGV